MNIEDLKEHKKHYQMLIAREMRLGELLGWTNIVSDNAIQITAKHTELCGTPPGGCADLPLPQWTRDRGAAWDLMVGQNCNPVVNGNFVGINGSITDVCINISDHPDNSSAMRLAVVEGVILKLEAELEKKPGSARTKSPNMSA